MRGLYLVFFTVICLSLWSQPENRIIDSLLFDIVEYDDESKLIQYLKIGQETRNMNSDTAYYYDSLGYVLAQKLNKDSLLILAYNNMALDYKQFGDFKLAHKYFSSSLKLALQNNDSINLSSIYNNLGVMAADLGKHTDALEYYIKSMKIDEKLNNFQSMAITYNNIGIVHYTLENYDLAMTYYKKAMKINKLLNKKESEALQLMNIGILHYFKDNYDSVFFYFRSAMSIWEGTNNLRRLAMIQSNLAEMHLELDEYDEAIKYLISAKNIYDDFNEVFDVIHTELLIGDLYSKKGNTKNALIFYEEALKKAMASESLTEEMMVYDSYKNLYVRENDYEKAYEFQGKYQRLKDSIFNKEKTSIIQEMETKYQTEKIQQQLVLSEKENKLNELEKKRLRIVNYFVITIALLLVIFIVFVIRAYQIKKRAFKMISMQNNEIKAQRNKIEKQNEAITDSINYAQRIQQAIIPCDSEIRAMFQEYFVFYLPKDVVSGDFYWLSKIENKTIITLADCTGHGVPGAFMSMLGMSYLNELAKSKEFESAADILEKLRSNIIDSLRQNDNNFEQIDGMDMALIILNNEDNTIEFAGARNSLYIISDKNIKVHNYNSEIKTLQRSGDKYKLFEIVADRMPVGKYLKMNKFTNHKISLNIGDQIIMFSDGIIDQFGGSDGAKFQKGNFKTLLLNNAHKNLDNQLAVISDEYFKWKGETEQIDDVSVFSFKLL